MQETAEQVASTHGASVILAEVSQPAGQVWWLQLERPVETVGVVMLDIDPQDLLKVARPTISSQSRHSAQTVRTQRSA